MWDIYCGEGGVACVEESAEDDEAGTEGLDLGK